MHELSVCQSIVKQINEIATQYTDYVVDKVHIRLGPLSGIVPDLLQTAFPFASANSSAADADLIIESMPIRVRCISCGSDTDANPNRLLCGVCGSWQTQMLSGDELILQRVELRTTNH
jgi:hydrogenase nickel incorporation protein HypA/HybF